MLEPADLTRVFRARGRKVTPQRQLLFTLLHDNDTHPTVDALYAVGGFRAGRARIVFGGLCEQCQSKESIRNGAKQ